MTALPKFVSDIYGWKSAFAPPHRDIKRMVRDVGLKTNPSDLGHAERFRDSMMRWISHSSQLDFSGCETKKKWAMSNGIHDAIIQQLAYVNPRVSSVVIFEDDYRFYQNITGHHVPMIITWDQLTSIPQHAYVIVSWPNHSGMIDDRLQQLISVCEQRQAKIFLDCAFYGTVSSGVCDTSNAVFDAVAFSVSKAFQCGGLRAGMVWGDDLAPTLTIPMQEGYNLYNAASAKAAAKLIERYPADWLANAVKPYQKRWCDKHGFEPADVCFFALSRDQKYSDHFRRGGDYLRVCISSWVNDRW